MLWILSTLHAIHGFVQRCVARAFLPLLLVMASVLSGAACRDDQTALPRDKDVEMDDSDASPIAGAIQGSFAVSSTGEATYALPLIVPPGAAGMQPTLAIAYNSASGDGMLGMGFSLSGLSAITRCSRTMAQDNQIRSVRYDQHDALCLDGARLVPVGSSGDGVVEYRTIPDTFVKVLSFPSRVVENPADTLKVFTRSGLVLEYGSALDASGARVMGRAGVIRSWLVQRARDRSENTIAYEYLSFTAADAHTTEYVPFRIRYTGNRSVLPSRTVQFTYEPKAVSDRRTLFAGGMALSSSQQLTAISMFGPESALVREYRFAYKTGVGTGRTVLRNIKECAADGTCKPRTTFAWYGGKPGFERIATPIKVPQSQLVAPMMLDVTGDGLDDLVVPTVPWNAATHSDSPTTDWTVTPNRGLSPSTGSWFFQSPIVAYSEDHNDIDNDPVLQQQPDLKVQPDYGTPIDYNQDGLTDVLVHNVHGTALDFPDTWGVLLATAQHTFTLHDTGVPRPKHLVDEKFRLNNREASAHLADVNGDGIADLLQCERDESAGGADAFLWTLRLWTPAGPGFALAPRAVPLLTHFHCAWEMRTVDVNADGKVDLVLPDISQNQAIPPTSRIALSYDEESDTWETEQIGKLGSSQGSPLFLDVNGDGLPDVVKLDGMTGQPVTILNTGDSHGGRFGTEIRGVTSYLPGDLAALWGLAAALDYDGDGRQDVLVPMKEGDGLPSWILLQAAGDGTFTLREQALPFDAELSAQGATIHNRLGPRITDVDGDGTPDVLLPIGELFTIFRSTGSQQDLLLSVHDGLNAHDPADLGSVPTLVVNYGTLIDKAITDGAAALPAVEDGYDYLSQGWFAPSCAYPLRCVVGPRRVVSEYSRNNGADKLRSSRVHYRGGRYDRRGRGFLGFEAKITTDLATGSGNIELYGDTSEVAVGTVKTYPNAGQLREAIRWTPNPRPQDPDRVELSFTSVKRELRSTNGGATYFLMPTEVSQSRRQGQFSSGGAQTLHAWLQLSAKATSLNVGGSTVATTDYDDYGNVLAAVTTTAEVDLTTTISGVKYNNHPDSWLIGQLASRTECSTAANLKQCRTVARTYDGTTGLLEGEVVDAEGDATMHLAITYGRDAFGNITSTTADDKLGNHRATWTTYEPSGVFPDKHANAVGHVVVPAFDAGLGVMTSLVDENQLTTTWKYDGFGRSVRERRPDSTETVRTLLRTKDGGPEQNEWNVKVTTTTKGGEDSAVQYDSLARPIRWWIHGTQTGHDPPPRILQEIVFDDLGEHVARRSTPVDEAVPPESRHYDEYAYDPTGRLLKHTTPWSATTSYEYEGKLVHATDPFNKVTTTESDALGRLVKVTDAESGITSYSYGPFGALWTVTDPGKAVTSTLRDAFGRVRTAIDPDKGTTILGYDGFNELTLTLDAQGRTSKFLYDPLGRKTRREDTTGNNPALVTTWTWDTALLGVSGKLAMGALAQVVGNQITRSGAVVSYTAFDMPKAFSPAAGQGGAPVMLEYDGNQRRVRKTAGDEVTVYVGEMYERTTETTTGAVEHRYFVHGSERVVAVVTRSSASTSEEKTRYLHVDNLGSVETVTDETGSKAAEKRSYDAFGARRNPSWGAAPVAFSSLTTRGFTGHEDDEELGLVNMKGRLYDPKVGRFLTTDPIVSHPGFGQSWNPYSYVLNNPLAFTDPSGFGDTAPEWLIQSPCGSDCVQSPDGTLKAWHTPLLPEVLPSPNVDASLAGLTAVPGDLSATGEAMASTPQALAEGSGGTGGAGPSGALSAGGGGADSGALTQSALHPVDYLGFQQNMNEQSRQYAVMAVLAPVRYPVVVGVIAFGLLNPDPVYAPTFQTMPEDRPSVLETAGETGLAIAVGAIGVKLGQAGSVSRTAPSAYSVAFEMKLTPAQYALPRHQHYEIARQALQTAMGETPALVELVGGAGKWGRPPTGWTWHHDIGEGIMQLVPRAQHTPGSPFWGVLHPGGVGGYSRWAIPAGAANN